MNSGQAYLTKKLLSQSFWDQLNSLQILEQLALLELAKQHLLADIIDILECLGKADNIPLTSCITSWKTVQIGTIQR